MTIEKTMILEMLKDGKISVQEADELLSKVGQSAISETDVVSKPSSRQFLRVIVSEENENKVNINIPIALAEVGLKLIPKEKLNYQGIHLDFNEILRLIKEGGKSELVNIDTNENGKNVKVKIFID